MPTPAGNDAFEGLLVPALAKAYRVALCLTRNPAGAKDLVQAASLLALRGFATFQTGGNFTAWLSRIVSNEYFSRYRQERRRGVELPLDEAPERSFSGEGVSLGWQGTSRDIAGELVGRLDAERIVGAMRALPDSYRLVATLYFVDDLAYEEIASTLGIAIGTVRSRLHRGRRMLMASLGSLAGDHGIGAGSAGPRRGIPVRRRATRGSSHLVDRSGSPAPRSSPPG